MTRVLGSASASDCSVRAAVMTIVVLGSGADWATEKQLAQASENARRARGPIDWQDMMEGMTRFNVLASFPAGMHLMTRHSMQRAALLAGIRAGAATRAGLPRAIDLAPVACVHEQDTGGKTTSARALTVAGAARVRESRVAAKRSDSRLTRTHEFVAQAPTALMLTGAAGSAAAA